MEVYHIRTLLRQMKSSMSSLCYCFLSRILIRYRSTANFMLCGLKTEHRERELYGLDYDTKARIPVISLEIH